MLARIAIATLIHEKEKLVAAVTGVAIAIFLVVIQWGFYFGYRGDITAVIDAYDADIWIIPRGQPSFDGYYVRFDDRPYWKSQQINEIASSARIIWGDATWRLPRTGGKDYVQVLGVDHQSDLRPKLTVKHTSDLDRLLRPDGNVVVARKDLEKLELSAADVRNCEISGRRATVVGFVEDIHLFTTAGFVMTDLSNAREFLGLPPRAVSYIACRCAAEGDIANAIHKLKAIIPEHDVLTTRQLAHRAKHYWETRSGFGPVILLSSVLAVLVGFIIVTLIFYISTVEKIPALTCMKAIGASNAEIVGILATQLAFIFAIGCLVAGTGLAITLHVLSTTTISVVVDGTLVLSGTLAIFACSVIGSLLSVSRAITAEPAQAFRT